jgi:hypothetical protein
VSRLRSDVGPITTNRLPVYPITGLGNRILREGENRSVGAMRDAWGATDGPPIYIAGCELGEQEQRNHRER